MTDDSGEPFDKLVRVGFATEEGERSFGGRHEVPFAPLSHPMPWALENSLTFTVTFSHHNDDVPIGSDDGVAQIDCVFDSYADAVEAGGTVECGSEGFTMILDYEADCPDGDAGVGGVSNALNRSTSWVRVFTPSFCIARWRAVDTDVVEMPRR